MPFGPALASITCNRKRARVAEPLSQKHSGNAICPAVRGSNPGSHIRYAQETWRNPGGWSSHARPKR
eukprot:scaffold64716_cov22-Tisochrysis_lutea.AAC.1